MRLWIDSINLIKSENKKFLNPGAIYFLTELKQKGFEISLDTEEISNRQLSLLEYEGLLEEFDRSNAEAIIEFDKSEGKYEFWISEQEQVVASGYELQELLDALKNGLQRGATYQRKTNETDISISLNLDGTGLSTINTGLKFFDHMLEQIAKHGLINLHISCDGDLEVDEHHTIEDVAIALGETITKALGDKKGIERYSFVLPMDEAQSTVALDLSGRPYLVFEGEFNREYVGDLPTEMVKHFFYSLAMSLKATLHINFSGENDHHKVEACFKGFARTLRSAVERNPRTMNQIPSSKGTL